MPQRAELPLLAFEISACRTGFGGVVGDDTMRRIFVVYTAQQAADVGVEEQKAVKSCQRQYRRKQAKEERP
jgi:hypothetical protein